MFGLKKKCKVEQCLETISTLEKLQKETFTQLVLNNVMLAKKHTWDTCLCERIIDEVIKFGKNTDISSDQEALWMIGDDLKTLAGNVSDAQLQVEIENISDSCETYADVVKNVLKSRGLK